MSFAFKAGMQACVLFLLNWVVWQPLQSVHHLSPMLIETSQLQEKIHKHLHADSSVLSHSETSSPADKEDQWQAEDDYWFFLQEHFIRTGLLYQADFFLKRLDRKVYNIKYTEIEIFNKILLVSEYSPRGPPLFLQQN